jgi:ribosomal protein S18 acetylase RimI-like enzyme
MKGAGTESGQFNIVPVTSRDVVQPGLWDGAVTIYQEAFKTPPYNENFTRETAADALKYILEQHGDLVFGVVDDDKTVSLAGGYIKPDPTKVEGDIYYVEELAVDPSTQGGGFGRRTLNALLEAARQRNPGRHEIRTTEENDKAIALYQSVGFRLEPGYEVVVEPRDDGRVVADKRVYLSMPPLSKAERLGSLKRGVVSRSGGKNIAVVFDHFPGEQPSTIGDQMLAAWSRKYSGHSEISSGGFVEPPHNAAAAARVELFDSTQFSIATVRTVAALITQGENYNGFLEVSGTDEVIPFEVQDGAVTVEVPLSEASEVVCAIDEGALVRLEGSAHVVVSEPVEGQTTQQLLARLVEDNSYELTAESTVGVTYFDQTSGEATFSEWNKKDGTMTNKLASDDGTLAIGLALAMRQSKSVKKTVTQPSGETLSVGVENTDGVLHQATITGRVKIIQDGQYKLS